MMVTTFSGHYRPSYDTTPLFFKCTVGLGAQRMTDLTGFPTTIPTVPDLTTDNPQKRRYYKHLQIQADPTNTGNIYFTFDNNTTPVAAGPGWCLTPGSVAKFELWDQFAPNGRTTFYPTNAKTAFQFISDVAGQILLLNFMD